jgi:hypothetical protein
MYEDEFKNCLPFGEAVKPLVQTIAFKGWSLFAFFNRANATIEINKTLCLTHLKNLIFMMTNLLPETNPTDLNNYNFCLFQSIPIYLN